MNTTGEVSSYRGCAGSPQPTIPAKRPKSARLSTRQLERVRHQLLNLEYKLRMAAKEDFGLEATDKALQGAYKSLDQLVEKRKLDDALRKDARLPERERECWTVYYPRASVWERQQWVRRTVHTTTKQGWSLAGDPPRTEPAEWENPWKYLAYELANHYPQYDEAKFIEHIDKVMRQFRDYVGRGGAEAEAEVEAFNRISPQPECPRCQCCFEVDYRRMVAACPECKTVWSGDLTVSHRRAA